MDSKISALNSATVLTDADVLPIVNQAETKKVTVALLKNGLVKTVVRDAVASSTITGTTAETLLGTYLIPANTYNATDLMRIAALTFEKTGIIGNATARVKVGSTNVFSSATTIATFTIGSTILTATILRNSLPIRGNNIRPLTPTSSLLTDVFASVTAPTNVAFNPTVDNYIFTSIQLGSALDSIFQSNFLVTN